MRRVSRFMEKFAMIKNILAVRDAERGAGPDLVDNLAQDWLNDLFNAGRGEKRRSERNNFRLQIEVPPIGADIAELL